MTTESSRLQAEWTVLEQPLCRSASNAEAAVSRPASHLFGMPLSARGTGISGGTAAPPGSESLPQASSARSELATAWQVCRSQFHLLTS